MERYIARIFKGVGGVYVCDDALPYLDKRGGAYRNVTVARNAAWHSGYTHCCGCIVQSNPNATASNPVRLRRPKYADDWVRAEAKRYYRSKL
jgi:hypothetical protein